MGTLLLEHARRAGVEKFVACGTICSYPKHTPVPFREESLWEGYPEETNAPYGLAKKMLLVQAQAYRRQYGTNAIYLMPTNLYGPGDNFGPDGHVIPMLVARYLDGAGAGAAGGGGLGRRLADAGVPLRRRRRGGDRGGDGALRRGGAGQPRLGARGEHQGADRAGGAGDRLPGAISWDTSKPNGQPRRCLDTSRAADLFGWRAQTGFEEGLRETVRWYVRERAAGRYWGAERPAVCSHPPGFRCRSVAPGLEGHDRAQPGRHDRVAAPRRYTGGSGNGRDGSLSKHRPRPGHPGRGGGRAGPLLPAARGRLLLARARSRARIARYPQLHRAAGRGHPLLRSAPRRDRRGATGRSPLRRFRASSGRKPSHRRGAIPARSRGVLPGADLCSMRS